MKTDNELIAEFMGHEKQKFDFNYMYSESFSELVLPCKKFFSLTTPEEWGDKVIFNSLCGSIERPIWDFLYSRGDLMGIFNALINAIKWYNEQKSLAYSSDLINYSDSTETVTNQ